ncbi:pullulanase-type alpha-1,6-glucosidase [Streptomyces hygroscopicus]|uniref:pullulanase-type alpha-1,6-glucosidase n=1 Tax=Streptomyces hygroscopicus TaxID=1912 RepID=UPI0036875420
MTGNLRRSVLAAALAALVAATLPGTAHAVPATHTPPPPPSDARLAAQPARPAVSREQFYLLMPDRFANGDPSNDRGGMSGDRSRTGFDPTDKDFYQGGDLKGLTKRLDYVKGLGTTAIWLTPVFRNKTVRVRGGKESASYHGYAVTDFTSVDPHFGTDRDLRALISKAHAKGMKVYFDVITNHTADTITYAEKKYGYRAKGAYPYLDTEGRPFDDSRGMTKVDSDSPPYTPENTGDMVPAWLNDTTMYHNRGDSTFAGESALYGDFYGLDDLWTERPEVVRGMEKIYQKWVDDFDVDGFRVDTAKNVNMEFWTQWATALDRYAAKKGRDGFFLFAEAFSADPAVTAPYLTQGRLDGTLDFPLQSAVRDYASRGGPPSDLATVFAQDYRYATDKTNAYSQVTFLGSHDMGRIGSFIASDHPHASDAELLRRDRLAHEVMFLTRGALSSLVLRAERRLGEPAAGPSLSLKAPDAGATGTVTLSADPGETAGARVVFAAQVGGGRWRTLGTADHAPYRITQVIPDTVSAGTPLRYKAVVVDRAGRTASALADTTAGQPPATGKPAAEPRHAVVHYRRADGDYTGLTLRTADGATAAFSGRDAYGAFAWLTPAEGTGTIPFTVVRDGVPEGPERVMDFAATGEVWTKENSEAVDSDRPAGAYPPQDTTKAVIHYHRPDGDYDGWGLHTWTGAAKETDWTKPLQPTGKDPYGITFEVPLAGGATSLSYVVHNGDHKDTPGDRSLDLATYGGEVWLTAGESGYLLPSVGAAPEDLDLTKARAQWIDAATVALPAPVNAETAASTQLVYSRNGGITVKDGALSSEGRWLRLSPSSLTDAQKARYPHLKGYTAFTVDPRDRDRVRDALTGQVVLTQRLASGALTTATGVQTQGVLDDLYAARAQRTALGPVFTGRTVTLSVWAPTAHQVTLDIGGKAVAMRRDAASGVWSATGPAAAWRGKPYRYAVKVWAPSVGKVVTNKVTDPYSVALTANSARSLVADLADPALAPKGWSDLRKPKAVAMKDAQIQELHIRDFSAADSTTPKDDRGTYRAFTDRASAGSKHLRELAASGTSYVHLLPAFDIASIPERKSEQATPECDLTAFAPDSDQQQACVTKTAPKDAYNWGYDPLHYTVPEGSYASDPDGTRRTVEFRQMVQSLNKDGLRVVMDVVYNHTAAAGQDDNSVLDTIVPGYYQRLNADGSVANSTCCANTAPENTMMGKLVVDSVVTWARQYKVDGFRFDLMGHHPKANMLAVRRALDELTLAKDGVEGKKIILYGEGWNFGEVADDARFEQATQKNMAGTGIATFSDRARDAVRGGAPFDQDPGVQGFASGLYTDPNDSQANGTPAEQKARLLHYQDLIKVGLSGNLADYTFTDTAGRKVKGSQVDYGGAPAGYAQAPGDALAYADAHDNESLYDALAYKLPKRTPATDRARMQVLALATATLSQGPALSQAGSDLLRSKSLDRNSFDSGDWFNAIRWDCRTGNGFGLGLPPAADNEVKWPYAKALLSSVKVPDCTRIHGASAAYQDLLRIRAAEPAFHLGTAAQVQRKLSFPLSGTDETPGVITMRLGDLVVVMNATPERQEQTVGELAGTAYRLHPTQAKGADPVVKRSSYAVKSGTFTVPARTVAVFTH